jgi:Leucine carboxyl methyltransferase
MEKINNGRSVKAVSCSPAVGEQVAPGESGCENSERRDGIVPDIAGVSVTMLWSLHDRASEARRPDGILVDPESVHIQSAIDYDFARHFGVSLGLLARRAVEIDRALQSWLDRHPNGIVVSLGEGLETQSRRVDNGRMRWLSVDLPDAIRLRERFLAPTHRFRHIATSALDPVWMDAVNPSSDVFIVAQGLLMYLPPEKVDRVPGSVLGFDTIPRWFSDLTMLGLHQTASYRLSTAPFRRDDKPDPVCSPQGSQPRVRHVCLSGSLTARLLPPSLDEWLPERHLARFVVEVTDGLDLSAMVRSYRAAGRPAIINWTNRNNPEDRSRASGSRLAQILMTLSRVAALAVAQRSRPAGRRHAHPFQHALIPFWYSLL